MQVESAPTYITERGVFVKLRRFWETIDSGRRIVREWTADAASRRPQKTTANFVFKWNMMETTNCNHKILKVSTYIYQCSCQYFG